jgi:hypothetical protein
MSKINPLKILATPLKLINEQDVAVIAIDVSVAVIN